MISIVIPTYNERENITGLVDGIKKVLGRVLYEIIVVDDESHDGTAEVVKKLGRIRLIPHPPPRIHGQSKSRLGRMVVTYVRTAITGT